MTDKTKGIVQRIAVTLYLLGILLCCVRVPWRASFPNQEWFLGYAKFWVSPTPNHPLDPVYEARKKYPYSPGTWSDEEFAAHLQNPGEFRQWVPGSSDWSDSKIHSLLDQYNAARLIPPEAFAYAQIDYARIALEVFCLTLLLGLALYLLRPIR
jgi:hypothetical protein